MTSFPPDATVDYDAHAALVDLEHWVARQSEQARRTMRLLSPCWWLHHVAATVDAWIAGRR